MPISGNASQARSQAPATERAYSDAATDSKIRTTGLGVTHAADLTSASGVDDQATNSHAIAGAVGETLATSSGCPHRTLVASDQASGSIDRALRIIHETVAPSLIRDALKADCQRALENPSVSEAKAEVPQDRAGGGDRGYR